MLSNVNSLEICPVLMSVETTERSKMDIEDILKNLNKDMGNPNAIFLREIALLMEENEILRVEIEQLKKALKKATKKIQ